jgi:O-acetyl-ADP-ribose deacetylase (regulator of RNase III)
MSKITYVVGDATLPHAEGNKIISHICNDKGFWAKGFVVALSNRWKMPEVAYRLKKRYILGDVDFVRVENDIVVANMIAQHDIRPAENGTPPIRYDAVKECLKKVNDMALQTGATIHMPRIGCGLAGGKWEEIEKIINEVMYVNVYVYDLK